jgi:hypothetical protein
MGNNPRINPLITVARALVRPISPLVLSKTTGLSLASATNRRKSQPRIVPHNSARTKHARINKNRCRMLHL